MLLKETLPVLARCSLCPLSSVSQWTAWTLPAPAGVSACEASATAPWDGEAPTVKHPGPRAWTSVQATGPSSQTPGFAAVTQAGLDTTVLSVSTDRRCMDGGMGASTGTC